MIQTEALNKSIDSLLEKEYVWMTRELIESYIESGAWEVESFVHHLEKHAKNKPDSPAIIDEDGSVTTYKEYDELSTRFALGLLDLGLEPGDRIALQLPNCSEFLIALMGAAKTGILPVLCHVPYTKYDLDYIFDLTEASAIVIFDEFKGRDYVELAKSLQKDHVSLEHIIVVSDDEIEGTVNYQHMIEEGSESR